MKNEKIIIQTSTAVKWIGTALHDGSETMFDLKKRLRGSISSPQLSSAQIKSDQENIKRDQVESDQITSGQRRDPIGSDEIRLGDWNCCLLSGRCVPVTSQVGRWWLSSSLWCVPSDMTSKLRMNMITTPSSFFTGTTSTMHRKHRPVRRDGETGSVQQNVQFERVFFFFFNFVELKLKLVPLETLTKLLVLEGLCMPSVQ